jgi:hypothetical protein
MEASVEIDGRLIHAFDLDGMAPYNKRQTGEISYGWMASGAWASGSNVAARIPALGEEHEYLTISMGDTGEKLVGDIVTDRHINFKPNTSGGYMFTRHDTRDNLGTHPDTMFNFVSRRSLRNRAGHVVVTGAEFGEAVDDSMATTGYRFAMGNNRYLMTVSDSKREAALQIRLGAEQSDIGSASGPAMPLWEPGDRVQITMANPGDVPDLSYDAVIVAVDYMGDMTSSLGSYELKKYV